MKNSSKLMIKEFLIVTQNKKWNISLKTQGFDTCGGITEISFEWLSK